MGVVGSQGQYAVALESGTHHGSYARERVHGLQEAVDGFNVVREGVSGRIAVDVDSMVGVDNSGPSLTPG